MNYKTAIIEYQLYKKMQTKTELQRKIEKDIKVSYNQKLKKRDNAVTKG